MFTLSRLEVFRGPDEVSPPPFPFSSPKTSSHHLPPPGPPPLSDEVDDKADDERVAPAVPSSKPCICPRLACGRLTTCFVIVGARARTCTRAAENDANRYGGLHVDDLGKDGDDAKKRPLKKEHDGNDVMKRMI